MNKKFNINIWDFIDTDKLKDVLENVLDEDENNSNPGLPSDISYHCITITREGVLTIDSIFELVV